MGCFMSVFFFFAGDEFDSRRKGAALRRCCARWLDRSHGFSACQVGRQRDGTILRRHSKNGRSKGRKRDCAVVWNSHCVARLFFSKEYGALGSINLRLLVFLFLWGLFFTSLV
jgi:hypothetical protein